MNTKLDRREQPQLVIQAISEALAGLRNWTVKEVTNQKFISPLTKQKNESFGYELKVPRSFKPIKKFWIGYLKHKDITAGIYSALTPYLEQVHIVLNEGYYESPFSDYLLIKKLVSKNEIDRMEQNFGQIKIKRIIKEILLKNYPFSLKKINHKGTKNTK
jgi:hypothetical protein